MIWGIIAAGLVLVAVFCYLQNDLLTHTHIEVRSDKLGEAIRIVHLSDMHSKIFKKDRLFKAVAAEHPDMICFTGDIADRYKSDEAAFAAVRQLAKLKDIAPVYAVSGNHEYGRLNREQLFDYMRSCGIRLLRSESAQADINGQCIGILGLDELGYHLKTERLLADFSRKDGFKLLLSHLPQLFEEEYCRYDIDLTLSGHAHGGQFILPFIGGLYAPGQGFLPKYYRGSHVINSHTLVVSRGLGNSRFPLRLFNYPEVVTIDIIPEIN